MPSTFTQSNLEDTTKHVERQNQKSIFTGPVNTRTGKEENKTPKSFLTYLQLVYCFKQDMSIELKPREEVEEY